LSADGHVVDKQYGCGAHSDTPAPPGTGSPVYEPFDDGVLDVSQAPPVPEAEPVAEAESAEGVGEAESAAEAEPTEPPDEPGEPTD
jgi:hypothetical protein